MDLVDHTTNIAGELSHTSIELSQLAQRIRGFSDIHWKTIGAM
jgi:hypothetical protein